MGDVYMLNGKILSGLPNHAKDIEFDNTGTTLSSTNTEDAIKEVNSNLNGLLINTLDFASLVDISVYTAYGASYIVPKDGVVQMTVAQGVNNHGAIGVREGSTILEAYGANGKTIMSMPVRKGQGVATTANTGSGNIFRYIPFQ